MVRELTGRLHVTPPAYRRATRLSSYPPPKPGPPAWNGSGGRSPTAGKRAVGQTAIRGGRPGGHGCSCTVKPKAARSESCNEWSSASRTRTSKATGLPCRSSRLRRSCHQALPHSGFRVPSVSLHRKPNICPSLRPRQRRSNLAVFETVGDPTIDSESRVWGFTNFRNQILV